jgi:hypothetical protein
MAGTKKSASCGTRQYELYRKIIAQRVGQYFFFQGTKLVGTTDLLKALTYVHYNAMSIPCVCLTASASWLVVSIFENMDQVRAGLRVSLKVLSADVCSFRNRSASQKTDTYKIIASCRLQAGCIRGLVRYKAPQSGI